MNAFGVTPALIRSKYFPHLGGAFTDATVPTLETVQAEIGRKAARLSGILQKEGVDASAVTDAASAAYLMAQDLLLLDVAIGCLEAVPGSAELIAVLEKRLQARHRELDENGWASLGAAEPEEEPEGPSSHLDGHTEERADIFRHDDLL